MRRKFVLGLAAALIGGLLSVAVPRSVDAMENRTLSMLSPQILRQEDYEDAAVISANTETEDSLSKDGQEKWYKYVMPDDGVAEISFQHPSLASRENHWRVQTYIYDELNGLPANSACDRVVDGNTNVTFPKLGLKQGRVVYISVSDAYDDGFSSAVYTLNVEYTQSGTWEMEYNNKYKDATPILTDQAYSGTNIDGYDDEDWYRFTLPSDGMVTIDLEHQFIAGTDDIAVLNLYSYDADLGFDEKEDRIAAWPVPENSETFTTPEIGLPAGSYLVRLSLTENMTDPYQISVNYQQSEYWEKEKNDESETANELTVGDEVKEYKGALVDFDNSDSNEWSVDRDWYKCVIPKDGMLEIGFDHTVLKSSDYYWYVGVFKYDPVKGLSDNAMTEEWVNGNDGISFPWLGLKEGDIIYISVKHAWERMDSSKCGDSPATYTIQLGFTESEYCEKEYNDSYKTATPILLDQVYNGTNRRMDGFDEDDWFTFTLPEDGVVTVDLDHEETAGTDRYANLKIYRYDDVKGFEEDEDENVNEDVLGRWNLEQNDSLASPKMGLPAGTYLIRLNLNHPEKVGYQLKVNFEASAAWEKEKNNEYKNANELTVGSEQTSISGTIIGYSETSSDYLTDYDWYKVTAPGNGKLDLSFQHEKISSAEAYWDVKMYSYDKKTGLSTSSVAGASVKGNANHTFGPIGMKEGDTFYIRVAKMDSIDHLDAAVPYTLTASFTEADGWEQEPNDWMEIANVILPGKEYFGCCEQSDNDWYQVEITEEGAYQLVCTGKTATEGYVSLYQADGETMIGETIDLEDQNSESYGQLEAGTYYLKFEFFNGEYGFSISKEEAHTHTFDQGVVKKKATCTQTGIRLFTCTVCGATEEKDIAMTAHKAVTDPAVEPTCKDYGWTEGSHCSECGKTLVAQTQVAKKKHTAVKDPAVEPTYTKTGKTEGSHCSVCGEVIVPQKTIPKKVKNGLFKENGKTYFYKNGTKKSGLITYKQNKYYFDPKTYAMKTGKVKVNSSYYYFSKKAKDYGQMQTGWITVGEKKLYATAKGVLKAGKVKIGSKYYYFSKKAKDYGEMQTGWITVGKKKLYATAKGVLKTGKVKVGSKYYYFSKKTKDYGEMQTGWVKINNKSYYFSKKAKDYGVMETGKVKIGNKVYKFSKTGICLNR